MLFQSIHKRKPVNPKNGKWKEFNKHAVLIAEGNYQHDLKHGLWRQYYETGELVIEEMYFDGVLHGRYSSYHLNGQLMGEGQYVQGRREGYFYIYDETGKRIKSMLFVNNVEMETAEKVGVQHARISS